MNKCPYCEVQNRNIAKFCKSCGKQLPVKTLSLESKHTNSSSIEKINYLLKELQNWYKKQLIKEKEYTTLVKEYESKIDAINASRLLNEAESLYKARQDTDAISKAKEALKHNPKLKDAYVIIAYIYESEQKFEKSVTHYKKALEIDSKDEKLIKYLTELETKILRQKELEKSVPEEQVKEEVLKKKLEDLPQISRETQEYSEQPESEQVLINPEPKLDKPSFDLMSHFDSFLEKTSLNWWYITGAFILLAGIIGLITWQWSLLGKYAIFALLFFLTLGMYWVGQSIVARLRLGGVIIISIASFLVPLNFYVLNAFGIMGRSYDWNYVGIIAALFSTIIYIATIYWIKESHFVYFSSIGFAVLVHFILQSFGILYYHYGLFYLPLAGTYMLIAFYFKKQKQDSFALALFVVANIISALSLGAVMLDDFFFVQGINNTIVMLLMASIIYFVGAYLFETNVFVYASSLFLLLFGFLLFNEAKIDWYNQGLYFVLFGVFFLGLGSANKKYNKESFAINYLFIGAVITLAVFAIFFGRGLLGGIWGGLTKSSATELTSTLITMSLATLLYAGAAYYLKRRTLVYISSSVSVYLFFVILAITKVDFFYYPFLLVLIICPVLIGIGVIVNRTNNKYLAIPIYVVSYSVITIAATRAIYTYFIYWLAPKLYEGGAFLGSQNFTPIARTNLIWTMVTLGLIFIFSTRYFRQALFEYPAIFCTAFVYGLISSSIVYNIKSNLFIIAEKNFGLYFVPVVVALTISGYFLKRISKQYSIPLYQTSLFIVIVSFLLQLNYVLQGFELSISLTFLIYSVLFIIAAFVFRKETFSFISIRKIDLFTYTSAALFIIGFAHLLYQLKLAPPMIGFYLAIASAIWLASGYILSKLHDKQWLLPLVNSSVVIGLVAFIFAVMTKFTPFTFFASTIIAILYTLSTLALKDKQAANISPFYFVTMYYLLSQLPSSTAILFSSEGLVGPQPGWPYLAIVLFVFTICFSFLAYRFNEISLAYAASVTLPLATVVAFSTSIVKTGYLSYYAVDLILTTIIMLALAYCISKTKYRNLASAPYFIGYAISAIAIVISLGYYFEIIKGFSGNILAKTKVADLIIKRNIAILTTVIGSLIYSFSAYFWKRKEFVYTAGIVATVAFPIIGSASFIPALDKVFGIEQNHGLYYFFFTTAIFSAGLVIDRFSNRKFSKPLSQLGFTIAMFSLASQVYYIDKWNFKYSAATVFILYCVAFAVVAYLRRKEYFSDNNTFNQQFSKATFFTYFSTATFIISFFLFGILQTAWTKTNFLAVFVVIAFFALSQVFKKFKQFEFERPLFVSAIVLAQFVSILAIDILNHHQATYNILTISIAFILLVIMAISKASYATFLLYSAFVLYAVFSTWFYALFVTDLSFLVEIRSVSAFLVAFSCLFAASKYREQEITYYGLSSLTFAIFLTFNSFSLALRYYPIYFIPYVIALLAIFLTLKDKKNKTYSMPSQSIAIIISLSSIVFALTTGYRDIVISTIVAYSVIYGIYAFLIRSPLCSNFAAGLFTIGFFYAIATWPQSLGWPVSGFAIILLSIFWFAVSMIIDKYNKIFSQPILELSLGVSAIGVLIALMGASSGNKSPEFAAYTMFVAGILYATMFVSTRKYLYGHLSFFAFLIGYYLPLIDNSVNIADAYLVPLGFYLIALGFIYKKYKNNTISTNYFFVSGLITVFGSTFIPSLEQSGALHAVLLLIECIAAIFIGISFRRKAFLFLGTLFIIPNGLVQFHAPLVSIHWAVYATFGGIGIITSGIYFERKRETVLERGRQIVETLREWD